MLELNKIYNADCLEKLKELDENSIDVVITDPPYGLEFMGKEWDKFKFSDSWDKKGGKYENIGDGLNNRISKMPRFDFNSSAFQQFNFQWATEVLRVLKPGGHLLAFGGSRTYHRIACAIEDAGFEIRDMIEWVYGSGFPKSLDIALQFEQEICEKINKKWCYKSDKTEMKRTAPFRTELANFWDGWGTALKPAHEPICIARKPISEKNIALNVLKWGTGGINIDGSRVALNGEQNPTGSAKRVFKSNQFTDEKIYGENKETSDKGRFPANLIHDGSDEVMECFPITESGIMKGKKGGFGNSDLVYGENSNIPDAISYADIGSASRFFYCAKASKSERDEGLYGVEGKNTGHYAQDEWSRQNMGNTPDAIREKVKNHHPTVKPLALMKYLVTMFSREGQIVLDCFAGSGTTLKACQELNRNYIGIEKEKEYFEIAEKRLEMKQGKLL